MTQSTRNELAAYDVGFLPVQIRHFIESLWYQCDPGESFPTGLGQLRLALRTACEIVQGCDSRIDFGESIDLLDSIARNYESEWQSDQHRQILADIQQVESEALAELYVQYLPQSAQDLSRMVNGCYFQATKICAPLCDWMFLGSLLGSLFFRPAITISQEPLSTYLVDRLIRLKLLLERLPIDVIPNNIRRDTIDLLFYHPPATTASLENWAFSKLTTVHNQVRRFFGGQGEMETGAGPFGIYIMQIHGVDQVRRRGCENLVSNLTPLQSRLLRKVVQFAPDLCPNVELGRCWLDVNFGPTSQNIDTEVHRLNKRLRCLQVRITAVKGEGRHLEPLG